MGIGLPFDHPTDEGDDRTCYVNKSSKISPTILHKLSKKIDMSESILLKVVFLTARR